MDGLKEIFPDSSHVRLIGLDRADDLSIWAHARDQGFAIVSFDSDFYERVVIEGFPPKVILLRCGNSSTNHVRELIESYSDRILAFEDDPDTACLELM